MKPNLEETYFCDYNHPSIQVLANQFTEGTSDPSEVVRRTFDYVRDNIVTGYDLYRTRSSEILKKGYAICWGKSILLVSLLRCNGIEAQFGTVPLHRQFIEPLIGPLYHLANSPYNHCIVHAYVNDRWTILDSVLDKHTFDTFFVPKNVSWRIDWNGKDDCRLYTDSVMGEPVFHEDIDETIRKKAGNSELPAIFAQMVNHYLNKRIWEQTGIRPGAPTFAEN